MDETRSSDRSRRRALPRAADSGRHSSSGVGIGELPTGSERRRERCRERVWTRSVPGGRHDREFSSPSPRRIPNRTPVTGVAGAEPCRSEDGDRPDRLAFPSSSRLPTRDRTTSPRGANGDGQGRIRVSVTDEDGVRAPRTCRRSGIDSLGSASNPDDDDVRGRCRPHRPRDARSFDRSAPDLGGHTPDVRMNARSTGVLTTR
jgi:hypothetical protein